MFKDNVTVRLVTGLFIRDPSFKVTIDRGRRQVTPTGRRHVPIVTVPIPENGVHTHLPGNGPNTIIDISLRWSPAFGSHACGLLDGLQGPVKFRDDFIVCLGGHGGMRPGVDADVVTVVEATLGSRGVSGDVRTNVLWRMSMKE